MSNPLKSGPIGGVTSDSVSGLGTIATQDADNVNIDGGTIDNVTIGGTTPGPISGTTGTFSGSVSAGTTLNVAGVDIARYMLMGRNVKYYSAQHLFTQAAVSGSGATYVPSTTKYVDVNSGLTPGSTALLYSGANNGIWSRNTDDGTVKWSKVRLVVFPIYRVTATANGKSWGFWGTPFTGHPTNTDPSTAGIGFRVDNSALKGIVHNGTSLTVVDLGVTLSYLGMRELAIVLDGSGNIYWYVDGVLSGQSDQAPIVDSISVNSCFGIWTTNGADSATQNLRMHDIRIWVEE